MASSIGRVRHVAELVTLAINLGLTTSAEVDRAVERLHNGDDPAIGAKLGRILRRLPLPRLLVWPGAAAATGVGELALFLASLQVNAAEAPVWPGGSVPTPRYVVGTRGVYDRHVVVTRDDLHAAGDDDAVARFIANRQRRRGVRVLVLKGVDHDAAGGISTRADHVTIFDINGRPVPAQLQQQEATPAAPAVKLWQLRDRWIAEPAISAGCGHYEPSGAYLTTGPGQLAALVGNRHPVALHDLRRPCRMCAPSV